MSDNPTISPIDRPALERALALRDLTDPAAGPHAMQILLDRITGALAARWHCPMRTLTAHPVVSVEDNYDRLHYPPDAITRDARYSRYVSHRSMLRTHTTAMIPAALRAIARDPAHDLVLVARGLVYRRDSIDRIHTGEPHQADIWRITRGWLSVHDLETMVATVIHAALPGVPYRSSDAVHPYTLRGRQIDVLVDDAWIEIGECGLALPALLRESGLDEPWSGLALGLGLDRILMIAKGIDDIRLLRSDDPRVARQMLHLDPYHPVSNQPATVRDLSLAVHRESTAEIIGDRVRAALGSDTDAIESIEILSETPAEALPRAAIQRIGLRPDQKNVLLRLVIRPLHHTITSPEANHLRDRVYAAVHEGDAAQWATPPGVASSTSLHGSGPRPVSFASPTSRPP